MTATIKLKHPRQLGPAVRILAKQFDRGVIKALQRTARYGATQAVKVSARSRPFRPRATGTYERSFTVVKVDDGAILTNSARHSIFVELGRKPGKMPPLKPIIEWVKIKKIGGRGLGRNKKGQFKSLGSAKIKAIAIAVQRKIARKGTKGRYVFLRTVPIMAKRLPLEIQIEMAKSIARAARSSAKRAAKSWG